MSAPSWVRRFSDSDGSLSIADFSSKPSSAYSISQDSRSHLYPSRSRENLAPETRQYRQLATSTGNLSRSDYSGHHGGASQTSRSGIANSGYVSDTGSSKYRSGNESGEEFEMTPRFTTLQSRKKQHYSRNPNRTWDRLPRRDNATGKTKREQSWSFVDSEGFSQASPSIHTSASYDDFEGTTSSTSGSVFIPRLRNAPSSSTLDQDDKRKRTRRKDDSSNETCTSGYSTNSLSEMSECTNKHQSRDNYRSRHSGDGRRPSTDLSPVSSRSGLRPPSKSSSADKISDSSHRRSDSKISVNDSDISGGSKEKAKKSAERDKRGSSTSIDTKVHTDTKTQTTKVPTIGNVAVTVTNNIQYDPNDPFSFIQPVELPFHKKMKKCLGPIMAVILLLVLAAALGAAIYFASALKETQEKQIDLLKANLALKIRNNGYMQNIDELSDHDFKLLSTMYCKQMDEFYSQSRFHSSYRGCEVLSFKNKYINFTLFFVEKEATSNQIISVIETSAQKVEDESHSLAMVDKFEVELDTAEITMERKQEPEGFNKRIAASKAAKVIELLCANTVLRIRGHSHPENIDRLTAHEYKHLSTTFCREMDEMYTKSIFKPTYRGCEILSFRTSKVNFTLYFAEKEPSPPDIINVIETFADKVGHGHDRVVSLGGFEVDLDGAEVKMHRKLESDSFNKILPPPPPPTTKAPKLINILEARVVLPVRSEGYAQDIDNLSARGFEVLSTIFCREMDDYFLRSQFQNTYRGCEVKSFRDRNIGYRVYFTEQELKPEHITGVIKLYAKRVGTGLNPPMKIDMFEVELSKAEVDIELRQKPEGFNLKLQAKATPKPIIVPDQRSGSGTVPTDGPVYSWTPCKEYEGSYFPHPVKCNMFFQCTNGESIEQKCTEGLLYHWKEMTCVSKYMPNVQCPDPKKAPPRPTTTTSTVPPTRSGSSTIDLFYQDFLTKPTTPTPRQTLNLPRGMSLTEIAGRSTDRPSYDRDPCKNGVDGNLYPHPDDCGMFIQCVNGKVQNMHCAPKLVFDPVDDACIFPKIPELVCPDLRPCKLKNDGYFPHPIDCSKFIQCHFKKEKVMSCKEGLVWNSKVNSCTHHTSSVVCPTDNLR